MKVGDLVRVIKVPPGVRDEGEFQTRTILEKCVGRVFQVVGFQEDWIELEVGEVVGKAAIEETIWIEPDCVEPVEPPLDESKS